MKLLTKAVFISTLLSAGFVQAAEPIKATPINIESLQTDAQSYVEKYIINLSIHHLSRFEQLVLDKANNKNNKVNELMVINSELIAD